MTTTEISDDTAGGQSVGDLAVAHLALLATVLVFLLTAIKIYIVSHGNRTTFAALADSVTPGQAILVIVPLVLPFVLSILAIAAAFRIRDNGYPGRDYDYFVVLFAFLVAFLMPLTGLAVTAACAIVVFVRPMIAKRRSARSQASRRSGDPYSPLLGVSGLVLLIASFYFLSDRYVWLPTEAIETSSGDLISGYVVEESTEKLTILRDHDRIMFHLSTEDVLSRRFCDNGMSPWYELTLYQTLRNPPIYARCPGA